MENRKKKRLVDLSDCPSIQIVVWKQILQKGKPGQ
jgi:hypothetical protein